MPALGAMAGRMDGKSGTKVEHPSRTDDRGFTVVELAITIALLGVVVVPFLLSTTVGIKSSGVSRVVAEVNTVLQNAADRVNRADPGTCHYTSIVQAAAIEHGWSPDRASAIEREWKAGPTPRAGDPGEWVLPTCSGIPDPTLIQRVDITVSSPDGKVTRKLQMVKSDV